MTLLTLFGLIILLGLALYLIDAFITNAFIKKVLIAVLVVLVTLYVLQAFGMLNGLNQVRIGR